MAVVGKSEFSRIVGVKPATVSNWIARQKLTAPALRADGKIDVELATQQLGRTVQPVNAASAQQRYAAEGTGAAADPGWSPRDAAASQLLRARALSASIDAEHKRRELYAERGKYVLRAEAEVAWARTLSAFLLNVEQSLTDLGMSLGLDRQQLVALRRWWRNQRARAAEQNQLAAAAEPEFVEDTAA